MQVLDRGEQAVARGAARCPPQVLHHCAQGYARSVARCAPQVLGCGAQAYARGVATLSQQEKNKSADFPRNKVNITGFICAVARQPLRRSALGEFESLAVVCSGASIFSTVVTLPTPAAKTSAWASGGPAGRRRVAE
jgi:hypothetical protein